MIQYIPEPASAGLILSYKCSAECLHCMYACSPEWRGDWIMEGDLEMILSQLAGKSDFKELKPDEFYLRLE